MKNYLFSLEAVSLILVECYSVGNNIETGGILIGPQSHQKIITDVIPSTAYAEREACTYYQSEEDVRILNQQLMQYQARGYEFRGYFHRHPAGLDQLSHGDRVTCAEILNDPNYKINNRLLMCIITESNSKFPVFSYVASLEKGSVAINQVSMRILPKTCIEECMECFEAEPIIEIGENNENHNAGQDAGRTEEPGTSDTLRSSGKGCGDNQLSGKKAGPEESRGVLPTEGRTC